MVLRSGAGCRRRLVGGVDVPGDEGGVHDAPRLPLVQRLERRPLLQQSPAMLQRRKFYCLPLLLTTYHTKHNLDQLGLVFEISSFIKETVVKLIRFCLTEPIIDNFAFGRMFQQQRAMYTSVAIAVIITHRR